MNRLTLKLSDINFGITYKHPEIEDFVKDYISDEDIDIDINPASDEEIQAEYEAAVKLGYRYTLAEAEKLCIYRNIAEVLPLHHRFLMHGACLKFGDDAYIFSAPSGVGKSTHIANWFKYLKGHVRIINGDKPLFYVGNGIVKAYGTPWAGKEGFQKNRSAELKSVCFIQRGLTNSIEELNKSEVYSLLFRQIYLPADKAAAEKTLDLIDAFMNTVKFYLLKCNISEEAVKCSFEGLTGLKFEDYKYKEGGN